MISEGTYDTYVNGGQRLETCYLIFPSFFLLSSSKFKRQSIDGAEYVGRGGALVESMTFNRRVVGSTPALAAT